MSSITIKMCTPATILINAARQHSFFAKLITLALYIFGVFEGCFRALVVTRMSLPIRAIVNFVTKDPEVFLGAARNVRTLFCPPKQGQKGKIPQMLSKQRGRTQEFLLSHVLYSMKLLFFTLSSAFFSTLAAGVELHKEGARLPGCESLP